MTEPIQLASGATVALAPPAPPTVPLPAAGPTAIAVVPVPGPQGLPGPTGDYTPVIGEVPAGVINGANATFTIVNPFVAGSTAARVNGLRQYVGADYTETGPNTIVFTTPPQAGDQLCIDYSTAPAP